MLAFFQGFGIGAGLIIAIGAQNSYVLSQGVRGQYILLIPLLCFLCDALLITAGAAGIGGAIAGHPRLGFFLGVGGSLFLFCYGAKSLIAALRPVSLIAAAPAPPSLRSVVLTTLALSLLNPHVYLDTVVLLGSVASGFEGSARLIFTAGACCASFVWFFALSLGGRLLEPLFRRPSTWKVLDMSMCLVMWSIAYSLWPRQPL